MTFLQRKFQVGASVYDECKEIHGPPSQMVGQVSTKRWRDSLNDEVGSYSKIDQTAVDAHGALKSSRQGKYMFAVKGEKNILHPISYVMVRRSDLVKAVYFSRIEVMENEGLSLLNISEGVQLYIRVCGDEMW
jgi:hypothetical protein